MLWQSETAQSGLARATVTISLAIVMAAAYCSPSLAQRAHKGRRTAANAKPPNASEPYCRSKARDYAYEKHADPGQERMAFEKCMGR